MGDEDVTPEQLAEQIRRLKVSDLVVSTCATVAQLGFAKLNEGSRDLEQAQLAIETIGALVPIIERAAGEEVARDFRQVVASLQLAYADAATTPAADEPEAGS
jgi:hypothetical protein